MMAVSVGGGYWGAMVFRRCGLSGLATLAAVGCGPGLRIDDTGGTGTSTGTATGGMTATGQDTDPAHDTGGGDGATPGSDSTGGGEDTGSIDTGGPNPPEACIRDGALSRPVAVLDGARQQIRILEPGSEVLTLDAGGSRSADPSLHAAAAGDFIAVGVTDVDGGMAHTIVRLFERSSGDLYWEQAWDAYLRGIWVDGQGNLSAALDGSLAGAAYIDGESYGLSDFRPAGPVGATGWMPGLQIDPADQTVAAAGLHDPAADAWVVATTSWQSARFGADVVEHTVMGDPPRLVVTRPDGETTIMLTAFSGDDGAVATVASAGEYRLVSQQADAWGDPSELVRVHLPTGEVVPIDPPLPAGHEAFDCYDRKAALHADGLILFNLRNDGAARVQAWDPHEETWTPLGSPMTEVDEISVGATFGRVHVIVAHGIGKTFCPPPTWTDPPGRAIVGSSLQLSRLDPPLDLVLDEVPSWIGGGVSVDEPEQCAAWPTQGGVLRIRDLDDGDSVELPGADALLWLD